MSGRRHPQRTLVVVGAVFLFLGSVILGTLPAWADSQSATTTTTTTTAATSGTTTTAPPAATTTTVPSTSGAPAALSPAKKAPPTTTTTTTTLPHGPPVPGGIVPCSTLKVGQPIPADDTCANMPCPSGNNCGVVVAGPTAGLGPGQYVYLHFYGFEPGDTGLTIYYCANPGGASTLTSTPTCANTNTSSASEEQQQVGIYPASTSTIVPQGTGATSMQAAEVSAPSDPLAAQQFNPTVDEPGFYCDGTTANACAIVITDAAITPGKPASTSSNSEVIPLTFAPSSTACPQGTVVSTESEFGIDLLMPEVARLSCGNDPSAAVVPFETATDGLNAVTDLVAGTQQVAFTDDPEAPDQQAELAKGSFALIPVALTANVVAFDGQLYSTSTHNAYNLGEVNLTPTMAAGLLTDASNDSDAGGTDDSDPCSGPSAGTTDTSGPCLGGAPCFAEATCSLFQQLNYIGGFAHFTTYQSVQRSDTAGATDQLFNWLCTAPKVSLDFGDGPTELSSGAQELELGLSPANGPPLTTCPVNTDQVPAIGGQQTLITVNDPSQQALKAQTAVANGTGDGATDAFTDMNWGESRYYGMNTAALQNAAGSFVTPSVASLDAALGDATQNPDGSYTPRNLTTDPAAYPMPSVIYAVVPTTPMDAPDAAALTDLLNQLLNLTGGSATTDLPDGFVPLPSTVATVAEADVVKDVHSVQPTPTTPTTPTTTGTTGTGTDTGTGSGSGSDFSDTGTGLGQLSYGQSVISAAGFDAAASAVLAAASPTAVAVHHLTGPLLGPSLPDYALVASHGRVLVPDALGLGIAALAVGLCCMGVGIVRRRRAQQAAAALVTASAGPGPPLGPEPEEGEQP